MNEFATAYVPTVYYDGGDEILIGAYSSPTYINVLNIVGARQVPEIELWVTCTYVNNTTLEITVSVTCNTYINAAPTRPGTPKGPSTGTLLTDYTYKSASTDADNDLLYYQWSWGDGDTSTWMGPYNSGDTCAATHSWDVSDTYQIKVRAKDTLESITTWSGVKYAYFEGYPYICGDANNDETTDVSDAVWIINYVFVGGDPPDPMESGDANCDGSPDVSDAVWIINYVFVGGFAPCDTDGNGQPDC